MLQRLLLLNAWRCRTSWERSTALNNLYISTRRMTAFSRHDLVEVQILFLYHRTLLNELKVLNAFSWCVSGIVGSVCPDGRMANTLVFTVLTVRPIEGQVESNDLNISTRSLLESARSTMSLAYARLLRRSSLINFFCPPTSFCSPMCYSRARLFCW